MKIVIIDTSISNIHSLESAINFLGGNYIISNDSKDLEDASHIILPGVGSFDTGMIKINQLGLDKILKHLVNINKIPFLGICLGMQLIFQNSEEGNIKGLGLLKGEIKKLSISNHKDYKIPNVGFNKIYNHTKNFFFDGINNDMSFYFTHSYALYNMNENANIAISNHSQNFISAFQIENICGTQFHPEKSQSSGLKILSNFFKLK